METTAEHPTPNAVQIHGTCDPRFDLVREALRESTSGAGMRWKELGGEPGESGTRVLIQKRRSAGEEEKANEEK